jgi:DNA adenine methylase
MIVLGHQAHGSAGASGGKLSGWRRGVRGHGGSSAEEWRHLWVHVENWAARIRGVYLENDDAVNVMRRWDAPDTLHYVDPPYVASSRTKGCRGYAHEMEDAQHRELAAALNELKGMVIVSGYSSPLYDDIFAGWARVQRSHVADKGNQRTEVCWMRNVRADLFDLQPG